MVKRSGGSYKRPRAMMLADEDAEASTADDFGFVRFLSFLITLCILF
jgi:hypothetical protein